MQYYIVFLTEGTVFRTSSDSIANEYKNREYCMVIDTITNKSHMFEDSIERIKEWKK